MKVRSNANGDFERNQDEQNMTCSVFSIWWPFVNKNQNIKKNENIKNLGCISKGM